MPSRRNPEKSRIGPLAAYFDPGSGGIVGNIPERCRNTDSEVDLTSDRAFREIHVEFSGLCFWQQHDIITKIVKNRVDFAK